MAASLRLYTFSLSHFSEKIRWALDASGADYEEVPWTPFLHIPRALRKGGKTSVPILEETRSGKAIQDSTDILLWLEKNRAPFDLIPSGESERNAVMELEDQFDRVGPHVIRYFYSACAAQHPQLVTGWWTLDSNRVEAAMIRRAYPLLQRALVRLLQITPDKVVRSGEKIDAALSSIEERISDGRQDLVGGQFSVADLGAAALLAPVARPAEHPIYGSEDFISATDPVLAKWAQRPAAQWVRDIYRLHRL